MMSDFLTYFLTYLPTHVRFFPIVRIKFYYMVSDFGKPTYLPKNRTSFMDVPLLKGCVSENLLQFLLLTNHKTLLTKVVRYVLRST